MKVNVASLPSGDTIEQDIIFKYVRSLVKMVVS